MFKVVLIDDEAVITEGLSKVVDWKSFGCEIAGAACDSAAGARLIRELSPDILFTDIKMPGESGLIMLAGLRSEFPEMQVTVLSGYSDFSYMQQAIELGVCRYLLKPSRMGEIEEALEEMTRRLGGTVKQQEEQGGKIHDFVVSSALEYIAEHCAERLTLTDVAEHCYVSQWHLSKLLNRTAGSNFYDLLNDARIKRAKKLLRDPSLLVGEVGELVGYADSPHFSRVFKRLVGATPGEYRDNLAEGNER